MERHRRRFVAVSDESIDPAIRVTGQVDDHATPGWLLVESMDRHDREDLFDGPGIRRRLEDREIPEVGIGQESS